MKSQQFDGQSFFWGCVVGSVITGFSVTNIVLSVIGGSL